MAYGTQGIRRDDFDRIRPGWHVIGSDGEQIGEVDRVEEGYFVISQGWIFTSERYVPITAIRIVDQEQVLLSVTSNEIEQYGWDSPEAVQSALTPQSQPEPKEQQSQAPRAGGEHEHMELREEELRAQRTTRKAGEVDVSKEVDTEREEMDVPRRHEEVDIDYRPADARRPAEGEIGEDEEIRVPLHEEDVQVDKETVVTGEVDIDKREVEETEHISEEVRKERMRIEREGDVRVNQEEQSSDEERPQ